MTLWIAALLLAQQPPSPEPRPLNTDPVVESSRDRLRQARDLGRQGSDAIPQLLKLYDDANTPIRVEVVRSLAEIGGPRSLDGLVKALADPDPEVQIRATDGLVNFYLPGYLKTGLSAKAFTSPSRHRGPPISARARTTSTRIGVLASS